MQSPSLRHRLSRLSRLSRWFGIGRRTFLLAEIDHLIAVNGAALHRVERRIAAQPTAAADTLHGMRTALSAQLRELARLRAAIPPGERGRTPADRLTDVLDQASGAVESRLCSWLDRLAPRPRG
jgi:hypothetical protein